MENRIFRLTKGKHGLVDIVATSDANTRKGKCLYNLWMGSLTKEETTDLHKKLGRFI